MAAAAIFFGGLGHGSDGARPFVVVVRAVERGEDEFQRFVVVGPAECDGLQLRGLRDGGLGTEHETFVKWTIFAAIKPIGVSGFVQEFAS